MQTSCIEISYQKREYEFRTNTTCDFYIQDFINNLIILKHIEKLKVIKLKKKKIVARIN